MKMYKWIILALIICIEPISANAEMERTVWAQDTRTPGQGKFLASLGYGYETYGYMAVDGEAIDARVSLSYGISGNLSAGVQATYHRWQEKGYGQKYSEEGAGDSSVITTFRVLDEAESGIDFAFRGTLGVPTGDEHRFLGTGNWEPKVEVLAAKTIGNVLAVTNLGFRRILGPGKNEEDFIVDADLECVLPLARRVSLSAALSGWTSRWKSSPDDVLFQVGFGLKFTPTTASFISGTVFRLVDSDLYQDDWYFTLGTGFEF